MADLHKVDAAAQAFRRAAALLDTATKAAEEAATRVNLASKDYLYAEQQFNKVVKAEFLLEGGES